MFRIQLMKKLIAFVLLCILYISPSIGYSANQQSHTDYFERWDAENYVYSNFTYGFGWSLPKDYEWKREIGPEMHTPFRASFGPIVVFVNAQINNKTDDLWKVYDQYTDLLDDTDIAVEKRTGQKTYERVNTKCTIVGKHAIKTTFKEYFLDSRFNEPIESYAEEYILIANGYTLIVAVKLPKLVYNKFDCTEFISDIFRGFRLVNVH